MGKLKKRINNAPPCLPQKRPRALTYPLPANPDKSASRSWNPFKKSAAQQTLDQSQSALFSRLPYEIRQLIWTEILGGRLLHIAHAPKRLLAIECGETLSSQSELSPRMHGCWPGTWDRPPGYDWPGVFSNSAKAVKLLALLQTCRAIYTEAISKLYKDNIFDINHIYPILYLRQSVLPKRLNQIRFLNFTWNFKYHRASSPGRYGLQRWGAACDVLASLDGLQELVIYLDGLIFQREGKPVLEAMRQIKAAKKFDVDLPCIEPAWADAVEKEGGYPFKLVRHPVIQLPSSLGFET